MKFIKLVVVIVAIANKTTTELCQGTQVNAEWKDGMVVRAHTGWE
jgi:hypothetical protein